MAQTLVHFTNGPRLLSAIALSATRGRPRALEFHVRRGPVMHCPNVPGARVPVYEVFAEDAYELEVLTDGLPDDLVAMDIGGQIGCFSVALAWARPQARVHAFEASPTTVTWLERNVRANGLDARVSVRHLALASHEGSLQFADNGQGSGLNGLTAPTGSPVIEVPCTTFGGAVASAGGRVDLVKIDTEGAEFDIVLGSSAEDWRSVQRIVIEHHPVAGHTWDELVHFFADAGFRVVRHDAVHAELGTAWLMRP